MLNGKFLVDCGLHCAESLRIAKSDVSAISDVFVTHFHEDHCDFGFLEKFAKNRSKAISVLKNWGTISDKTEIYISHLAPSLHKSHAETVGIMKKMGVKVAYDGLTVKI